MKALIWEAIKGAAPIATPPLGFISGMLYAPAAQVAPAGWGDLIQTLGLPTAMLVIVFWLFVSEQIFSGKAYHRLEERGKQKEADDKTLIERLLGALLKEGENNEIAVSALERLALQPPASGGGRRARA